MWKKQLRAGLALLIALITVLQYPLNAFAEENVLESYYISAVSIGSEEELRANGYTVVKENLNEDGTPLYIGYQYTDDPELAITDISAMGMYGGYSELNYRDMLLNDSDGVRELGLQLQTATKEFRTNYYAGNPFALIAYDTLNALVVPNDDGTETPLGDYFLSEERSLTDFKTIGLMCSNVTISYILNQLCFGVADDVTGDSDESWLHRLCSNGPLTLVDSETGEALDAGVMEEIYLEEYDNTYMQRAQKLYVAVSAFADDYNEALLRSGNLENIDFSESETFEAMESACDEISGGSTLDVDASSDPDLDGEECGDLIPLAIYQVLDAKDESGTPEYPYGTNADGSTRTLAEFFLEVGEMDETEEAYRALYPLMLSQNGITPLTDGQETMIYLSGLTNLLSVGCSNADALEQAKSNSAEQIAALLDANNGNCVSIWHDVNTEMYDATVSGVYWTSSLAREAAAHDRYDLLTKPTGTQDLDVQQKLNNAMIYAGCVGLAALGAAMIAAKIFGVMTATKGIVSMISCAIVYMTAHTFAYSAAACVACVLGTAFMAIVVLAIVAIIVIALVKLFQWLFDDDDEPELQLTEIPRVIYDYNSSGEGSAVSYQVVNLVGTETAANLNDGLKNTPWVALYYSRDTGLGDPITVEMMNGKISAEPFTLQTANQIAPEHYSALCAFESITAANLNEGRSGVDGLFCFLHREAGSVTEETEDGLYLMEVTMVSEKTEEAAKAKLIDKGYHLIDYNLTSDGSIATYIGYLTTDDASYAITDLRVAYSTGLDPNGAAISYGGAQYGCCGNAGNLLLMESKWACAGSPILASDLVVTSQLGDAPEGYEPVNLFCGGPAFDFNQCDNWEMTDADDGKEGSSDWDSHTYIYFHPSVTYTSGTEYLGGLAFFSGKTSNYIKEAGWTELNNASLNGGSDTGITYDLSGVQEGNTVLCYTATYNPYRAIYDIQYYCAEASAQGLPYNLSLSSGNAVACDVYQQSCGGVGNNRLLRVSHAYRSNNWYEGGSYFEPSDYVETAGFEDTFDEDTGYAEWYSVNGKTTACNVRCTGLYVVGNTNAKIANAEPIQLSELLVSASPDYDASAMTPVRSITDSYSEQGANLAFHDLYRNGNMYLYILRKDNYAVLPTYIASVTVAYVEGADLSDTGSSAPYDSAVYQLVGNGAGRLYELNLTGAVSWDQQTTDYYHDYEDGIGSMSKLVSQKVSCISHRTNYGVALIWITYTNAKTQALSDLVIYASDSKTLDGTVTTADGSATVSCGDGFRENGTGTYYFLRAIYNSGNPITDLLIDQDVMLRDYWTSISADGTASDYDAYYIKTKHFKKANLTYYISGIYMATGKTPTEAQRNLLSQGCRYFCPFNLSPDAGDSLYIGYSLSTSYKKAYSGLILYDAGQDSTVDTIVKGRDTYTRVSDSLNSGVYDSLIYMYLTNSVRKACESGGTKASNGHYITDIAFFSGTDLNDYATGKKSLDSLDAATRSYIESYIYDDDGDPIYWDIVTDSTGKIINCNLTALNGGVLSTTAPQVYMYVHYSDNATPYFSKLSGSVFADRSVLSILLITSGSLLVLAAVYLLLKRYRKVHEI